MNRMESRKTKTAFAVTLLASLSIAQAQSRPVPTAAGTERSAAASAAQTYAQALVDSIALLHPELREIDLHATPRGSQHSVTVAAKTAARVGHASDADDLDVFRTGQPRVEINRHGDQNAEVELPLYDIFRQVIGTVEFTFPYPPGTDSDALAHKAGQYRDEMSRRILTLESLGEPAQLDARISSRSYAQFLVDEALRGHPGIEVLALHARTPETGADYPIVASNIGRIGKPADADDLEVIRSGKPEAKADARGARFEAKVPLKDASGAAVGTLGVIFPYRRLSSPAAMLRRAEGLAAEMGGHIASAGQLADAYPAVRSARRPDAIAEYNTQELGNKQELPMTKEVASGAAMGEAQEGYSDAIKNQAGVQATNSSGSSNDAFAMRGIKLNLFSNYRLDGGLPVAGVITNPTENKQRVETLKGANALMFGVASPAGIINFVTKRAGPRDVTNFGAAGNSFGQYYASVDIGRRFGADKQLGLRFNASGTHLENGVHDTSGEGYFASLGVDWRASPKLTLQGDLEFYQRHVPEQAGIALLPAKNGVIPITPVPEPRNLLSGSWNVYTPKTINLQLRADYALTDHWKLLVQGGQSDAHRHRNTIRISGYDIASGANGVVTVQPLTNTYRNTFARTEVLGHFDTWSISHDLTVGLSQSERYAVTYDTNNLTLPQRQNIYDPIVLDAPVFTQPNVDKPAQTSTDSGVYGYDTVGVTPRLKLLLGVRRVQDKEKNASISSTSYVTSPAYGVLFDIRPTTTLFASSMEGLEAGGTAPANAANANEILTPTVSKQKEIGIRDSYFKGLSVSASYFKITRGNAVTDPADNVFKYLGEQIYKGVETTVSYQINRNWQIHGAALRLNVVQNSPSQPLIDGKVPENTPKWNANLGLAYRVSAVPGLTLKAALKKITERPVNNQDQGYIPGVTVYDAGLSYATQLSGRKASFGIAIANLTDKRYWNSVQTGTYGIGMDRSLKFNAKIAF